MILSRYTCAACEETFREPEQITDDMLYTCPYCGSDEIEEQVIASVDHDDAADAKRRAEIKLFWDRQYAGMDFLAAAREIVSADVDTATVPVIRLAVRQAS